MKQSFTIHLNENSHTTDDNMNLVPAMMETIIEGEVDIDLDNFTFTITPKLKFGFPEYPLQWQELHADSVVDGAVIMSGGVG